MKAFDMWCGIAAVKAQIGACPGARLYGSRRNAV